MSEGRSGRRKEEKVELALFLPPLPSRRGQLSTAPEPCKNFILTILALLLSRTELYSREALRSSKRIANPGCFATSSQLLLAPLLPYLDAANPPSIFAVSGYSGAGTKTGPAGEDGKPTTVSKVVSQLSSFSFRDFELELTKLPSLSLFISLSPFDPLFSSPYLFAVSRIPPRSHQALLPHRPHPRARSLPPPLLHRPYSFQTRLRPLRRSLVRWNPLGCYRPSLEGDAIL